jgi:hypothetical protein
MCRDALRDLSRPTRADRADKHERAMNDRRARDVIRTCNSFT